MDHTERSTVATTTLDPSQVLPPHQKLMSGCTLMDMAPLELGSELCGDLVRTEIESLLKSSEIHKLSDKFGTRYI